MTRREAERQTHQADVLRSLGFTPEEAESLRRISMTLQRWFERECGTDNGCIERDEATDRPMWRNANTGRAYPIPDRETGARRRLAGIISARNQRSIAGTNEPATIDGCIKNAFDLSMSSYIQTDPRGAALYIIRPGDVPDGGDVSSYYSRGVCVY